MSSLVECSNLGHQHPRLVTAIREQAAKLALPVVLVRLDLDVHGLDVAPDELVAVALPAHVLDRGPVEGVDDDPAVGPSCRKPRCRS